MHTLKTTSVAGLTLWHDVPQLGTGVAENVVGLIKHYADGAALEEIPPISLSGSRWDAPWQTLVTVDGCIGNSGPSDVELLAGSEMYTCLEIRLPEKTPHPIELERPDPRTIEGVIAHEITHLRWPSLRHGPEFDSRVIGLLRGAVFPLRGGWKRSTKQIMEQARREVRNWYAKFIPGKPNYRPK